MSRKPFLCHFIDDVKDIPNRESTDLKHFLTEKLKVFSKQESISNKQVLMLTRKLDPEADLVGIRFVQRGIDYTRLNIDDIPNNLKIRYTVEQDANLKIECTIRGQVLDPSRIPVVLLRDFDIRSINFDYNDLTNVFTFQQWDDAYRSLQSVLNCEWISRPDSTIEAGDRIQQLSIAKTLGFKVPSTLITNDPAAARDFYYVHHGNIVLKALHHHSVEIKNKVFYMYTHIVQKQDLSMFDDLIGAPCILQERLDKRSELRVTVVGERVFAAEIDSQSNINGRVDMHRCQISDLPKRPINLENATKEQCIRLIKSLGLRYGAIDFVLDKHALLYFLEVNPTGDWLWIEGQTGLKITEAVVDLIEGFYRRP